MATSSWFKRVHESGLKSIKGTKERTLTQRQRDVKDKRTHSTILYRRVPWNKDKHTSKIGKQKRGGNSGKGVNVDKLAAIITIRFDLR
jgi:hypothetical protein